MRHTPQMIVLGLLVMIMAMGSAHAQIADSVAGFSDTQGLNGWYYGEWFEATAESTIDDYSTASFLELPFYNASAVWGFAAWMRGPGGTDWWPFLGPEQTQPSPFDTAWSVRRWVSTYTGLVQITGQVYRLEGVGGDGIRVSIMKNASTETTDDTLYSVVYAYDNTLHNGYSVTTTVSEGDVIDFMVDRIGSADNDRAMFTAQVWTTELSPGPLSGHVELQNFYGSRYLTPVLVELVPNPDGVDRTERVYLDANDNYIVPGVTPGNYNVYFSATGFLRQLAPTSPVTVTLGVPAGCDVSLINGDVDGDNEVTTTDLSVAITNLDQQGD